MSFVCIMYLMISADSDDRSLQISPERERHGVLNKTEHGDDNRENGAQSRAENTREIVLTDHFSVIQRVSFVFF